MRARVALAIVPVVVVAGISAAVGDAGHSAGRYVVRPGDSLSLIARRFDVSLAQLLRVNALDPSAFLQIGTVIRVPSARNASGFGSAGWSGTYVVRPGDTLGGIAGRFGVSLGELAKVNGLDAAGLLLAGARLIVPAAPVDLLRTIARSEVDPYPTASRGIDFSYPDCARPLPGAFGFAIVGLNDGRPFTTNPCFAEEYAAAKASSLAPSVYVNSAYAPSLRRHITNACLRTANEQEHGRWLRLAYALGCSEGGFAEAALAGTPVAAIWIDVEPANTWSRHPSLNRATIAGLTASLMPRGSGAVVGVYSAGGYWRRLTGGWSSFAFPEWIATGPGPGCSLPFAAGPVWLSQHGTTSDHDISC